MSSDKSGKDIEALLLKDPHIVAIHRFEHEEFPEIDYSMWKSPAKAERAVGYLQDYIDTIAIEDDFGNDHDARQLWRKEIGKNEILREVILNNSLKGNTLFTPIIHVENLIEKYIGPGRDELKTRYENLFEYVSDYGSKSFDEKLSTVTTLKQRVYGILQYLSEQSPAKIN